MAEKSAKGATRRGWAACAGGGSGATVVVVGAAVVEVSGGGVVRGAEHIAAGGYGFAHLHRVVARRAGVLHHDHRVGARGQHAAGGDSGDLSGTDGEIRPDAHGNLPPDIQISRVGLGRTECRCGLDGKTIHS